MDELRETLMREMRQLQQENRESKVELERVRRSNLGSLQDEADAKGNADASRFDKKVNPLPPPPPKKKGGGGGWGGGGVGYLCLTYLCRRVSSCILY